MLVAPNTFMWPAMVMYSCAVQRKSVDMAPTFENPYFDILYWPMFRLVHVVNSNVNCR